jgi:hypothetical protein
MTITFVARYEDEWEVLEIMGPPETVEWALEDGIGHVLGWEEEIFDRGRLRQALGEFPLVRGTTVFCQAHCEDRTTHGPDGTEYDYEWVLDVFVYDIPKEEALSNAIFACENWIARGGECSNKYCDRLKGANFYARKYGLCDQCAKTKWREEIETAKDPLWKLRQQALRSLNNWAGPHRAYAREEQIAKATTEQELIALRNEYERNFQHDLDVWRMYQ